MQWVPAILTLLLLQWLILHRLRAAENHLIEHFARQTAHLQGVIMTESQDAVDAVTAQLGKASGEILTEIANLQAQVDAGQPVDLTALKAAAQSLDDINPDAPVEPEPEA